MDSCVSHYLKKHTITGNVIVCVSGGVDSMVLGTVIQNLAPQSSLHVTVITVDHKLRPESTDEAHWVSQHFTNHHILTWLHDTISTRIQETARDARYKHIIGFAKQHHIQHVFLAHHADDQVETFFMRLYKGTGLKGLSCMDTHTIKSGISFHRPLLDVYKNDIIAYANRHNIPFVNDPSNEKTAFKRVALRKSIAASLTNDEKSGILKSIHALSDTQAYLQQRIEMLYHDVLENNVVHIKKITALEPFEQRHVLRLYIQRHSPKHYPAPLETVDFCLHKLFIEKAPAVSAHGLILKRSKGYLYTTMDPRVNCYSKIV